MPTGSSQQAVKQFETPKLEDPSASPELQSLRGLSTEAAGGQQFDLREPNLAQANTQMQFEEQTGLLTRDPEFLRTMGETPTGEYHGGMRGNLYPNTPTSFGLRDDFAPKYEPNRELYQLSRRR